VRLVVVDSIAFHVRANSELTYAKPLQLVGQMAQLLSHAARRAHRAGISLDTWRFPPVVASNSGPGSF